jgi:hypothetical protein
MRLGDEEDHGCYDAHGGCAGDDSRGGLGGNSQLQGGSVLRGTDEPDELIGTNQRDVMSGDWRTNREIWRGRR